MHWRKTVPNYDPVERQSRSLRLARLRRRRRRAVDIEGQIYFEIGHPSKKVAIEHVPTLTVEKPADKKSYGAALRTDSMGKRNAILQHVASWGDRWSPCGRS